MRLRMKGRWGAKPGVQGVPLIDMAGMKVGGWHVLMKLPPRRDRRTFWLCKCAGCGAHHRVWTINIRKSVYGCRACAARARRVPDCEWVCRTCGKDADGRSSRECKACARRRQRANKRRGRKS